MWYGTVSGGSNQSATGVTGFSNDFVATDLRGITFQSNDYILFVNSSSNSVRRYQITPSTKTLSNSQDTIDTGDQLINIAVSDVGGNTDGNLRFYTSTIINPSPIDSGIIKFYNTSAINGPIGTSIGGDPHIKTADGKSVIIVEEDPFVYLDTSSSLDKEKLYVWCDSFTLSKNRELVSEYQFSHVDTTQSYLRSFNLFFYEEEKLFSIKVDMITLAIEKNFEENKNICITERVDIRSHSLEELRSLPIRNTHYLQDLLAFLSIRVLTSSNSFYFEFIRTECINYSDIFMEVGGDISTFRGVIINGEVYSPERKYLSERWNSPPEISSES